MKPGDRDFKIDVLRGIAVLGVFLIHTQNAWYLGVGSDLLEMDERLRLRDHWLGILSIPVTFGFLGLNLFFLLSGFCIHLWKLKRSSSNFNWRFSYFSFMKRRLTRLYPAYFSCIVFSLGCLGIAEWIRIEWLGSSTLSVYAENYFEQTIRYLTFTQTLSMRTFAGYNPPLYTMAIEFHFYLFYPLVLWAFQKLGIWQTLGVSLLISFGSILLVIGFGEGRSARLFLDSILVRWPEWIAGCVIAEQFWRKEKGLSFININRFPLSWVLGMALMGIAGTFQIFYNFQLNVLWTAGLMVFMARYLFWEKPHQSRLEIFLTRIGLISFSVYLIHYPILRVCAILMEPKTQYLLQHLGVYVLIAPFIFLVGFIFFKAFEEPFLFPRRG